MDPISSVHSDHPRFQNDSEEFGEERAKDRKMLKKLSDESSESGEDVYMEDEEDEDAVGVESVPVIEEETHLWRQVRWTVYSLYAFQKGENIVESCLIYVAFLAVCYFDFLKDKNKKTPPGKGLLAAAAAAAPKAAPEGGAADIV